MKQIPLTQGLFALVDEKDYDFLMQWNWHALRYPNTDYAARRRRKSEPPGPSTIRMHRVILQPPSGLETDHINGNGLDNRRKNLRIATKGMNIANRNHQQRRAYNLPMGVYRDRQRFQAKIGINGHRQYLGRFGTPEEAYVAYAAARQERIAREAALI